jgi:hypothetical protein
MRLEGNIGVGPSSGFSFEFGGGANYGKSPGPRVKVPRSMVGAGYGVNLSAGQSWSFTVSSPQLIEIPSAEQIVEALRARYEARFEREPGIFGP